MHSIQDTLFKFSRPQSKSEPMLVGISVNSTIHQTPLLPSLDLYKVEKSCLKTSFLGSQKLPFISHPHLKHVKVTCSTCNFFSLMLFSWEFNCFFTLERNSSFFHNREFLTKEEQVAGVGVKLPVHVAQFSQHFPFSSCFFNPASPKVFEISPIITLDVRSAFGFAEKNRLTASQEKANQSLTFLAQRDNTKQTTQHSTWQKWGKIREGSSHIWYFQLSPMCQLAV